MSAARDLSPAKLEVIACSLQDALAAAQGGADRLEIVRDLASGGLAPAVSLVREIRRAVSLPLRVMLRLNESYRIRDAGEREELGRLAGEFAVAGADGFVLGFLAGDRVDVERSVWLLGCAPGLKATFHHAFDDMADPFAAIVQLKRLVSFDRILSSGRPGDWNEKARALDLYQRHSAPEIVVIAGGGLRGDSIRLLLAESCVREFHVGRAARACERVDGPVEASRVRDLAEIVHAGGRS